MNNATISYAITVCNEHVELERLLKQLIDQISSDDEIVIQADADNFTDEVHNLMERYADTHSELVKLIFAPLNKNFADFKNNIKSHCKNDYIVFIDADEYLSDTLLYHLKTILKKNPAIECVHVPRCNTVTGLTKEHVSKWRWQVDKQERVNWPDYQTRIIQNKPYIKWEGKVHEKLTGWKISTYLPDKDESWCLYHPKDIVRQEKQNELYSKL
jgi:glycosyltransferase involved in cell wall biosynthesis